MTNKGEILLANLEPTLGTELKKARPVLVVSKDNINKYTGQLIIIPFTSKLIRKDLPDIVEINKSKQNGLSEDSILHCIHIRSISQIRVFKSLGKLEKKYWPQVEDVLKRIFEID